MSEAKQRIYLLIVVIQLCNVVTAFTQQLPHYTQYVINPYIVNPAITGIENYTDVKLSFRNQWSGFPGAPTTFYASAHTALNKSDYSNTPMSFSIPGENPRGKQYWENYTAASPHHGIGGSVVNYRTGYISRTLVNASYAYHLGLTPKVNLSAGFSAGISGFTIDASKIELANSFDPVVSSALSSTKQVLPDLNAGLFLYTDQYFIGLSAQQVIPQKLTLASATLNKSTMLPHLFATTGYRFLLNEDINILPSVMIRYISGMPLFADVNVKAQYRDLLWVGGNIRYRDGFSAMVGLNISNIFTTSYSFDLNQSKYMLPYMHRGSHELVVGFIIGNTYGDTCPKRVW